MQIPLSWLKEFVEIDIPAEKLADVLTKAGLEVSLTYVGVPQTAVEGVRMPPSDHLVWSRDKIVLGAIREVVPHPNADRLVMAMVDYGAGELEQVVTGAPNLFEFRGAGPLNPPVWTALALEGAEVWDGHSDEPKRMILKGKPLRGVFNKSMVCSDKELGISEEHDGVILMRQDPGFSPGTPLQDVLGDVIMTVELTPNLARCYSVIGVAREVAALLDKPLKSIKTDVLAEGDAIDGQVSIEIRQPELNPRFTLALLKGVTVKPSPEWVQRRLVLIGQRPINNIVDITNYVMFETGQPLHAFDYDVLVKRAGGKAPTIITRLPNDGEKLTTLDGVERALGAEQILVCDTAGALSLGGVMGGGDSEISDATTNVLLEAAAWNFINIRKTAQAQKLFSEAGTRFSRGVHPAQAEIGLKRAIELMREVGGGKIAKGIIDVHPQPAPTIKIELPESEIERLTGMRVPISQAGDILSRLGFGVTLRADSLVAVVPDHRMDISDDEVIGQADLIEEIARIIGLDNLPVTLLEEGLPAQWSNTMLEREEQAKDVLVGLGLSENITHRFVTPEQEALFIPKGMPGAVGVNAPKGAGYVMIANPIQPDKTALRHSVLTNLVAAARNNLRHTDRVAAFELGLAYYRIEGQQLPDELPRLAIVMAGPRTPAHWTQAEPPAFDFYDLKGVVESLVEGLHLRGAAIKAGGAGWLHPGRAASLTIGDADAGSFGELHPLVAHALDLPSDTVFLVAEFDAALLLNAVDPLFRTAPVLHTPVVKEDLAFVVEEGVQAGALQAALEQAGGAVLRSVVLFDVYRGGSVPAGHKSLAYSVVYQADDHTLSEAEIAAARKKLVKAAQKAVGATLRA